ncbi:MAG: hypothetical protein JSS24_06910 [Proteobacteria bacterium]|nr:hypothetical protein [Pseudomonadota bacterium]
MKRDDGSLRSADERLLSTPPAVAGLFAHTTRRPVVIVPIFAIRGLRRKRPFVSRSKRSAIAVRNGDDYDRCVTGSKVFITCGERKHREKIGMNRKSWAATGTTAAATALSLREN